MSEAFSSLDPTWRLSRFVFQALALAGCGLFVFELLRNRRLMLETQQQTRKMQERFHALVETSPAAIVTVDQHGIIELANRAALELIEPASGTLIGEPISDFVPELQNAAMPDGRTQIHAPLDARARRANGEYFRAEVWFSTFEEHGTPKQAVIIADMADERPEETPAVAAPHSNGSDRPGLTRRQLAILQLVCQGLRNAEIEERLQISGSSVKNNLQRLFMKTGARNRSQLVRAAFERYSDLL